MGSRASVSVLKSGQGQKQDRMAGKLIKNDRYSRLIATIYIVGTAARYSPSGQIL